MTKEPTGFTVTFCTTQGAYAYESNKRLIQTAFLDCVVDHQRTEPNAIILQATVAPRWSQQGGEEYWEVRGVLSQGGQP